MKKLLFFLIVLPLLGSCSAEKTIPSNVNVKPVAGVSNATSNALVYCLPATKVRVDVTVEKTISKVGPFYRYSQKLLNVTDVVTEDKVEWKIRDVSISTYGVPDDNKRYVINYSGSNVAPLLNVTPDGVLYGVNSSEKVNAERTLVNNDYTPLPDLADVNFNAVPMLEKQLVKTSTAAMAEEAANFIYKVRKRRFKILASDYEVLPPDGQAYQISVKELNELEHSFMELFVGRQEHYTTTRSFYIEPDRLSVNSNVLFRFSSVKGVVDKMDVSGAPVYIEIVNQEETKLPDAPVISTKEQVRNGLYYCKPGKATIKLIDRNKLIKEQEVFLGQYGQIISLPASVLEEENVCIKLDERTGALKSIERKN